MSACTNTGQTSMQSKCNMMIAHTFITKTSLPSVFSNKEKRGSFSAALCTFRCCSQLGLFAVSWMYPCRMPRCSRENREGRKSKVFELELFSLVGLPCPGVVCDWLAVGTSTPAAPPCQKRVRLFSRRICVKQRRLATLRVAGCRSNKAIPHLSTYT